MDMERKLHVDETQAVCGRSISYLYRRSGAYFTQQFKDLDLSAAQSIVLVGIYRYDGLNQRTLADMISMTPGVVSRTLRELEDKGYVEKERDEANRRNYLLHLTPAGMELTETSLRIQGAYWDALLQGLSPEEIATLNALLQRVELRASTLSAEELLGE